MEKELSRGELERLISRLLKEETVCVIATCSQDVPRASTVEFFPSGTTLYILTEGGEKVINILKNPHVSVAIHAPFAGWESVRGLQITGTAQIGRKGSKIFEEGVDAYRNRRGDENLTLSDFMIVIRVMPERVEYVETVLGNRGLKVRHTLEY
jgi:hypothetical protein